MHVTSATTGRQARFHQVTASRLSCARARRLLRVCLDRRVRGWRAVGAGDNVPPDTEIPRTARALYPTRHGEAQWTSSRYVRFYSFTGPTPVCFRSAQFLQTE